MPIAFSAPVEPTAPSGGRVLVVDDEAAIRQFVTVSLRRFGHSVDSAAGVGEALDKLRGEDFEVVLVDLVMPDRTGLHLLEAIRKAEMPVLPILLSGTADVSMAVAGMKSGAFDFLHKPVEPDVLVFAVRRALDVAHARRRERSLERVVAEWETTFDAAPDLLLVLGPDGHVLRANAATAQHAGVEHSRLVGRTCTDVFPGALGDAIRAHWRDEAVLGVVVSDPVRDAHYLLSIVPIRPEPSARAVVVVVRDVTGLAKVQDDRKRLLRQLLSAHEDERRRLACDLHDGVGQALVTLSVGLACLSGAEHAGPVAESARRLHQVAVESLDEIRRLAHGLRPASLDDHGLTAALRRLTEVFSRVHGIQAALLVPDESADRFPPEVESTVYRIVQEALSNVAKHARARTVDVLLELSPSHVWASVTDDGVGIEPGRPPGFGLKGMQERAELLGGALRVESTVGRGTVVVALIPRSEAV